MKETALAMLTPADRDLLQRCMQRVQVPPGGTLLQEGTRRRALLIVRSGTVRVERRMQGRAIVLRELGAGEVLGEIGFVEDAPASASVMAQERCEVDVIEGDALQSLIAAEPGFAARFFHSLAVSLARRTRSGDVARMAAEVSAAARVNPFHRTHTGNLSARQLPPALEAGLEAFERELLAARLALRRGAPADGQAPAVATACDAVVALLHEHTAGDALTDIGWSDLLAFRDAPAIEAGIGDLVFRETFGTFMQGATMARCHAKPRGFPDDHETMAAIHRNEAEGDDWTGPLIDRWFLDRPLCRSRRAAVPRVHALLQHRLATAAGATLHVASLASGCAAELLSFFGQHPQAAVCALCVDVDEAALLAAARRAEALQLGDRMRFVLGDALPDEGARPTLQPQHVVLALGLCDYLDDTQVVALLDHAHALLAPGGVLLAGNLATGQPDRDLMAHLLDWQAHHRTANELQALVARSAFAGAGGVELDVAGVTLYATCTKAP